MQGSALQTLPDTSQQGETTMAGIRLEHWDTLPREELSRRISIEQVRNDLSFAETQLLNAARERLSGWPAPSQRMKTMQQEKKTETTVETPTEKPVVAETITATPTEKDVVVDAAAAKKKPVAKKTAKAKPSTKSTDQTKSKESTMAAKKKTSTKTAKTAKPAKAAKVASNGSGKRIPDDAVLRVKKSFKNPYKEGSGPYKRFEIMTKSDGKTYGVLRAMTSVKNTTPLNFVKAGGGEFIHSGK